MAHEFAYQFAPDGLAPSNATMGSLYHNTYSTILLLGYHDGLDPDRFLPVRYPGSNYFLVPVPFLELCNNQGICIEFYLIYIH